VPSTTFKLLPTQYKFVNDFSHKELAFIGGYGCGKSVSAVCKAIKLASMNLNVAGCILSPTHGMLVDTLIPTMKEVLEALGIKYHYTANPNPKFIIQFKRGKAKVFCRSAENYRRLASLNLAWAVVDEADMLNKSTGLAMWKFLQSRLRVGTYRQLCATSTPEGFNVLYDLFEKNTKPFRNKYHASTRENHHLPDDYIETLYASYTANEIEAYIDGKFTNLKSGTVYHCYTRKESNTKKTIESFHTEHTRPVLHVGVDFNVGQTCGIVCVVNEDVVYVVDELTELRDTEELIELLLLRYKEYKIFIYPDSSGKSRQTATTTTDIAQLKEAFGAPFVKYPNKNPRILSRVKSVNSMFCNSKGVRRMYVNKEHCPILTTCLEQQAWNDTTGLPDKSHNIDHPLDAFGYFIHLNFGLERRPSIRNI